MATTRPTLAAVHREITGKKVARLRRVGQLPAVIFGHGVDSAALTVDRHEFDLLRRHLGANALIDLHIDGAKPRAVLIRGVQPHPVSRAPLHVEFFEVRMTEELTVDVQVVGLGEALAVTQGEGTLIHGVESIKVRARPDRLPDRIEVSVESLIDFDAAIHARDLVLPAGVTLVSDPDEVVLRVLPPRIEHEVAPPVAVPGVAAPGAPTAEGAEGEEQRGGREEQRGGREEQRGGREEQRGGS